MITLRTLVTAIVLFKAISTGQESDEDTCEFPFIYQEQTFYTCIFHPPVCSTKAVYEDGSYVTCTDTSEMDNSVYAMDMIDRDSYTLKETGGYIASHRGYNNVNYPNRVEKTLKIPKHLGYYLLLRFITFSLQTRTYITSWQCSDYLTIRGIYYCGRQLDGHTRVFDLSVAPLKLNFKTSYLVQEAGFVTKFTVITEDCNPDRLLTAYEAIDWSVDVPNTFTATCSLGGVTVNETLVCHNSTWAPAEDKNSMCFKAMAFLVEAHSIDQQLANEVYGSSLLRSGYISSHDQFPRNYSSDINSSLTISGLQVNQVVSVTFLAFDLYYTNSYPGCDADYLEVIGAEINGSRYFCSDPEFRPDLNKEYNFTITGSSLTFRFITNGNPTTGSGFLLFYLEYYSTTTPSVTTTTDSDLEEENNRGGQSQAAVGAGVGVAALLVVILVVVVVVILLRRKRDKKSPVKAALQEDDLNVSYTANQGDNLNMHSIQQQDSVGGDNSTYALADEITTDNNRRQDDTSEDYKPAAVTSQQGEGEYDLSDEYQLAGACGDEYENLESQQRAEQEKAIPDVYAAVTGSRKMKKSGPRDGVNELIDNDLYGT